MPDLSRSINLAEAIREIERELRLRSGVYPSWVSSGRLTQVRADYQTAAMQAALRILKGVEIAVGDGE